MGRKVTRARVSRAYIDLQSIIDKLPRETERRRVSRTMTLLAEIGYEMRRAAIFAAGAKAKMPLPVFEGDALGSLETVTFFTGYSSTHPGFKYPYSTAPNNGPAR